MKRTRAPVEGFTLIEIMIVVAIIALLAAMAIPNVLRGRTTANETAAIANTRALIHSLEMFHTVNNIYPGPGSGTWQTAMYGTDCNAGTAPAPDFGPASFCGAMPFTTQGYTYTFTGGAGPSVQTYTIVASPQIVGTTGTRSFFADQTGIIRHCNTPGTATANSATIDTAPVAC